MHMTSGELNSALNITAQVVVKPAAGKLVTLVVNTGGTATLNDSATIGGVAAANQIAVLGAGSYLMIMPFLNGLVVSSAGAACAVSFE